MQVRHAIGVEDLGEDIFTLRTVYNFRRALVRHMEETGENLFERMFQQVTGEQQRAFEIRSARLRMDSTQIASNVRAMSRLELPMVVVQRMYRALDKEDQERWQVDLAPYVADSAKHLAYRLRGEEPAQRVTEIGRLMERLACELPAKYRQTKAYEVLCRVLSEHFVVVNHVAMRRLNEDLEARSVQSPDDLDATFRRKAGRGYRGYVANITETCDEGNAAQLIVDVAVAPNSTDDGQMLVDAIESLARRTDVERIYTDGGCNAERQFDLHTHCLV